ncbi:MAG: hypothetical protein HY812_16940 [Planctomycetes bacterium]|nr:hypothetical protein [Planctomycetota bacterium]
MPETTLPFLARALLAAALLLAGSPGGGDAPAALVEEYLAATDHLERYRLRERLLAAGKEGGAAVVERLRRTADDPLRHTLILLLSDFRAEDTAAELFAIARTDQDYLCRYYAILGLGGQGERGIAALDKLLDADLGWVDRTAVIDTLAGTHSSAAIPVLARVLQREQKSDQGERVASALLRCQPEAAVEILLASLSKAEGAKLGETVFLLGLTAEEMPAEARRSVEQRISRTAKRLLADLDSDLISVRTAAARALGALRYKPATEQLEKELAAPSSWAHDGLWALARIDAAGHADLFAQFLDPPIAPDDGLIAALWGLAAAGDAGAAGKIEPLLAAEQDEVVAAAARALGALGARGSAPAVAQCLLREGNAASVDAALLSALRQLRDPGVVYPLARFLRCERAQGSLARQAIATLGALPCESSTRELLALTEDTKRSSQERIALLEALHPRAGEGSAAFLVQCCLDADADLAAAARRLLGAAGCSAPALQSALQDALLASEGDPLAACRALLALEALGRQEAVDALVPWLDHPHFPLAAASACTALALCGPADPRIAAHLEQLLPRAAGECGGVNAPAALRLLGLARSPAGRRAALDVLRAVRQGPAAAAAWKALCRIGLDAEGSAELLALLAEEPDRLAPDALQALLTARDKRLDVQVLALGKKCADPAQCAALQVFALRSGQEADAASLAASIRRLAPALRCEEKAAEQSPSTPAPAHAMLEWLTGSAWKPGAAGSRRSSPLYDAYPATIYTDLPDVPAVWRAERWLEEHAGELREEAFFGAAVRAPGQSLLREYLKRHPQGRFAGEARALLESAEQQGE